MVTSDQRIAGSRPHDAAVTAIGNAASVSDVDSKLDFIVESANVSPDRSIAVTATQTLWSP